MHGNQEIIDVSVIVLTYCHEKYIAQALDSILSQETELRYEILIGDDASADRTPEIIHEYAQKYPEIIKAIFRKSNIGGTRNYADLLRRAQGKYLAVLEGDDFWISSSKMDQQFDFLEKHPEYIGCCSKCIVVDDFGIANYARTCHFVWNKRIFTLNDFIESWQLPGQVGTMMFRNIFCNMPMGEISIIWTAHTHVDDKTVALLLLSRGPIYCSNMALSAYRFVDQSGKSNWFSIHHMNPYRNYDMFMYACKLESWARRNLSLPHNKHFGVRNPYRFSRYVEECIKKPERKKFFYLLVMITHSHQPLKYSWYVLKSLIEME